MKYLLLDIDETIYPWLYKGRDAVVVERMDIELAIPQHIADWLAEFSRTEGNEVFWATSRPPVVGSTIERALGFKTKGYLSFPIIKSNVWVKQQEILKFTEQHPEDLVIVADNDVDLFNYEGALPKNLFFVKPSDKRECLSNDDLKMIDEIQ